MRYKIVDGVDENGKPTKFKIEIPSGLEALKDLMYYSACCRCQYYIDEKCANKDECCWKIIEKELKEYQQYKEILNDYGLTLVNFREACLLLAMLKGKNLNIHDIAKRLKALEIINNKGLNVAYLKSWLAKSTYEEYQEEHKGTIYELTQEEYYLLKEVLL